MGAAKTRPQELAWNSGTMAQKQLVLLRPITSWEATIIACKKLER